MRKTIILFALLISATTIFAQEKLDMQSSFFGREYYQGSKIISSSKFKSAIATDGAAYDMYRTAVAYDIGSLLFTGASLVSIGIGAAQKEPTVGLVYYGGAAAMLVGSFIYSGLAKGAIKKSIRIYNSNNSLGLSYHF